MIGQHFIATYQQAGDFVVVNVDGKLQKNGGNVASFFCTADGRVIHAVGNNIQADRLLREAEWAVTAYRQAQESAPDDPKGQTAEIEAAHLAKLHTSSAEFQRRVAEEWPRAREDFTRRIEDQWRRQREGRYQRSADEPYSAEALARRWAAEKLGGERAHQILAAQPLAPIRVVGPRLFEQLSGEKFTADRGQVSLAAQGLATARGRNLPMLLVFYDGHGPDRNEYDDATKRLFQETFHDPRLGELIRSYIVVAVPQRQMAALSRLAELPMYTISHRASPLLIVARPTGEQVAQLPGNVPAQELVTRLAPPLHACLLENGEQLVQEGKSADALKLFRLVQRWGTEPALVERAKQQIGELNFTQAETYASRGNVAAAIRVLNQIAASVPGDTELHGRATSRIVELKGR